MKDDIKKSTLQDDEIPEEKLKDFINDFHRFSPKRKRKNRSRKKKMHNSRPVDRDYLEGLGKKDLVYFLYKLKKSQVDRSFHRLLYYRVGLMEKEDLIKGILALNSIS